MRPLILAAGLVMVCAGISAQQSRSLDAALRMGADYFTGRLPSNTKIAVAAVRSPTENLSNYVIDTTVMHLVNTDKFAVIERSELSALQEEQRYQLSGEVSDETAVSIGHQLGVQVIITGAVTETGDNSYSLRLKAIDVKTAQIAGTRIFSVERDQTLTALLKPPVTTPRNNLPSTEIPQRPAQTVINGDVNITNNNTTTINGDVYVNKPNWFTFE
ncbi:MAG: CsgG/HfaB family protein [Treponema sp.]|jgi:hypothetical protein|nr:CsgG/HfaB family protein [Treponema sp.]